MNHPDEPVDVASETPEAEPPRRRRRWPWIAAAVLAVLVLAVALLGPSVIASLVRSGIEDAAARRGYEATTEEVAFSWADGLLVRGLEARERRPHGNRLTVPRIEIGPRWRDLLVGRLGFGRFRVERPHLIVDTRRRPDPPPKPGDKPPKEGDRPSDGRSDPLDLDLPITVVGGVVEVRGREGVPGFRIQDLDVDGRARGEEMRLTGTIQGLLLSGPLREALHVEGDVALVGAGGLPEGSAKFRAAGLDVGAIAALFAREGRPGLERGRLGLEGELKAEGRHLTLRAELIATDLRVTTGRAGEAPIEEPRLVVTAGARLFPAAERLETKVEVHATDLAAGVEGWVRGKKAGALDLVVSTAGRLERARPFASGMEQLAGAYRGRFRLHGEDGAYVLDGGAVLTELVAVRAAKDGGAATTVQTPEAAFQVVAKRFPDGRHESKLVVKSALLTVSRPEMRLEEIRVAARATADHLELDSATAKVNGGATALKGGCDLKGEDARFQLSAETEGLDATSTLAALLGHVVPLYHVPKGVEAQLGGRVTGRCEISGPAVRGKPFDRNQVVGTGAVSIDQGFVHGSALVAKLLSRLGGSDRYAFDALATRFRLADGRVHHESFEAKGRDLTWGFRGSTGFDGTIDYRLDPGPIVERVYRRKEREGEMRGWEKVLNETLGSLSDLPLALRGTLDSPKFELSAPRAAKPTKKGVEKVVGGLFDDLLRRRKEREAKKREKKEREKAEAQKPEGRKPEGKKAAVEQDEERKKAKQAKKAKKAQRKKEKKARREKRKREREAEEAARKKEKSGG